MSRPTLYHCAEARSFRVLWALEEMGLAYDLRMLPFPPRELSPDFLAINPLGTIPFFTDGPVRMTESTAILLHLAAARGPTSLAVPSDDPDHAAWLNWIAFGEATLTFPQTLVLRYGWTEPPDRRQPQIVEDYGRWFFARLRAVTAVVSERDWLCAGRFTMADVSVGYALLLAEAIGLGERFAPPIISYWQRLQTRDGFRRAVAAERRAGKEQGVPAAPLRG